MKMISKLLGSNCIAGIWTSHRQPFTSPATYERTLSYIGEKSSPIKLADCMTCCEMFSKQKFAFINFVRIGTYFLRTSKVIPPQNITESPPNGVLGEILHQSFTWSSPDSITTIRRFLAYSSFIRKENWLPMISKPFNVIPVKTQSGSLR